MHKKYTRSLNREENTLTLTDSDLKKHSYKQFKAGLLLFYELDIKNFSTQAQEIAKDYAADGVSIVIQIGTQKRILIIG